MQPRQVWRHHGGVNAVAFSPDGKWMASAGAKRAEVALQDRHTLCTARVLSGHEKPVCSIAFSADSTRLATGDGKGTIRLWNVVTASEVLVIGAHKGRITALDFTPDGNRVVSASMDKTIRFWDTHEGTQTLLISDLKSRAQDLAITPDGKELITAGAPPDSWLRVWNAATREFLRTVGGYGGGGHGYTCVDVSPDGRLVAAGGNCGVCVRERTTGKTVAGFAEHSHVVESVAFLAHERVLSSGYDGAARVLDVRKSRQVLRFRKSGHRTVPVPEGDGFAAFDSGRQLRLWSLPSDDVHTMSGRIPVFSTSGGELATVHGDSAVVIRDTLNWLPVDALPAAKSEVLALGFSPNDKTLAMGCANGSIRLWHRGSADVVREVQAHDGEVGQVSFSPTGRRLVSTGTDGEVIIWDSTGLEYLARTAGIEGRIRATTAAFNQDETRVAVVAGPVLRALDIPSGQRIWETRLPWGESSDISWSPDGKRIAVAGWNTDLQIHQAGDGSLEHVLRGHEAWVSRVAFSGDGRRLFSAANTDGVRVWDPAGKSLP